MSELYSSVGTWLSLLFLVFVTLLMLGANFAPDWAKSRGFLLVAGALVVIGGNSIG